MKFFLVLLIAVFIHGAAAATDIKCERILPLISDLNAEDVTYLYSFKTHNNGQWLIANKSHDAHYALKPAAIEKYKFAWTIKSQPKNRDRLKNGELACEVPIAWQLNLNNSLRIVYPSATHSHAEETTLHSISTFAGIYLGKSKYSIYPHVARIMWHLYQAELPEGSAQEIIGRYPFITMDNLTVIIDAYDRGNEIQLVALNLSASNDIGTSEQRWLITDVNDHAAIRDERYATAESKHNTWLPWLDLNREEFKATSAHGAYTTTIVAPLAQAKIFDRSSGRFIRDPISVPDKMQLVYDIFAPLVRGRVDDHQSLFAHLLLRARNDYQLATFEILQDGSIETSSTIALDDLSEIGLPSVLDLGFHSNSDL